MSPFEMFSASIGNFGFPIVISIYLLIRFEKRIEVLTTAINELKQVAETREKEK
ncbi:YvrJ family protein [Priestia sp. TSO9]|uniref:YvrJ family protein n=1 Tax=Priestia sp. TSO9 TaxID=2885632 RepID=UPI001E63FA4A|nr:YvrJ family protein [Priestia sp. TSO9]